MILKLNNFWLNLENFIKYHPDIKEIHFEKKSVLLTEAENEKLSWFLEAIRGPRFGIFDVDDLYRRKDEIQKAGEAVPDETNMEREVLQKAVSDFEAKTGKKPTPEQLDAARKLLAETTKHKLPLKERLQ